MIRTLLNHQWKSFWRSRSAGKNLALQIIIGFFTVYFMVTAIGIGFLLQHLLMKAYPGQDVIKIFCSFILYYFLFEAMARFWLQDLPTLTIQPYLVQNIKRKQLIGFLNVRSLFTVFNLLPLFLFTPFTFAAIAPAHGFLVAFAFITSIMALTVFNHFLLLYIKRKGIINGWAYGVFLIALVVFIALDFFKIFSLRQVSASFFSFMMVHAWLCILLIAMAGLSFFNNYSFLLKNLYLEDIVAKGKKKDGADYAVLNRLGETGELIGLDIKMILRNKRPRSLAMLSAVFLFYGFLFYKPENLAEGKFSTILAVAVFINGIFTIQYGQFLFAWQSVHFDGLMAGNLHVKTYIKSKFVFFTIVCTCILLLTSLYGLLSWKILVVQLVAYLYNVGILSVIAVYFATRSYTAIDITKGTAFNFQGAFGAEKWLYSMAVLAVPMAVYLPLSLINPWAGIAGLVIISVISLLLQNWWIDLLTKAFLKRKYKILDGFREK